MEDLGAVEPWLHICEIARRWNRSLGHGEAEVTYAGPKPRHATPRHATNPLPSILSLNHYLVITPDWMLIISTHAEYREGCWTESSHESHVLLLALQILAAKRTFECHLLLIRF